MASCVRGVRLGATDLKDLVLSKIRLNQKKEMTNVSETNLEKQSWCPVHWHFVHIRLHQIFKGGVCKIWPEV